MYLKDDILLEKFEFYNIFIIDSRNQWNIIENLIVKDTDLVLCLDFGLKYQLEAENYQVRYLDKLVKKSAFEQINFKIHDFLEEWSLDLNDNLILVYKDFNIAESLKLEILGDSMSLFHYYYNLKVLELLKYNKLTLVSKELTIQKILSFLRIKYDLITEDESRNQPVYNFPITDWMNENIEKTNIKRIVIEFILKIVDKAKLIIDGLKKSNKQFIYIQPYHPTKSIINHLSQNSNYQLILANYNSLKRIFKDKRVYYYKENKKDKIVGKSLLLKFKNTIKRKIDINDENDVSILFYDVIEPILEKKIFTAISNANSIVKYFNLYNFKLMIPITELWMNNNLIIQYCKNKKIPVFLILNGLLNVDFYNDAKKVNFVNCFSKSVKKNYFRDSENVFSLGDPRMDKYNKIIPKSINYTTPCIIIGTAAYDLTDLNAYLSFEFEFIYDILYTIQKHVKNGKSIKIILKNRPNNYPNTYKQFIEEYFPNLEIQIIQNQTFEEVIKMADLYISFYSQTIFEASCLGIPTIYYKKDTQFIHEPFNEMSELITAKNPNQLYDKLNSFFTNPILFKPFMEKDILEKYIGFLDGNNTERNIDFINKILAN